MAREKFLVAAASSDGIVVNRHFGKADRFFIYEVSDEKTELIEVRQTEPVCENGNHDEERLEATADLLSDCNYLIVSKIGNGAANVVTAKGIEPYEIPGIITESIEQLIKFIKINELFL